MVTVITALPRGDDNLIQNGLVNHEPNSIGSTHYKYMF